MSQCREKKVVLLATGDLHFSSQRPKCRHPKSDWFNDQGNYLDQINILSEKYDAPWVFSGDIFHSPQEKPEIINFVLSNLPKRCYAIWGQHDAPYHQAELIHKSAYWTLVKSGKIINLRPNKPVDLVVHGYPISLHGFPWGTEVAPLQKPKDLILEIAIIHQYVWIKDKSYDGAPETQSVYHLAKKLKGFDIAVTGDNHQNFLIQIGGVTVLNNGTFMRRRADEINYHPCVGLIYSDGSVVRQRLDTSKDVFVENAHQLVNSERKIKQFVDDLGKTIKVGVDFESAVRRELERLEKPEREWMSKIVLSAME